MDRPVTTLFMLMSVDGKISTGATDNLDLDRDLPKIAGVQEGLHQYYEIEQTTHPAFQMDEDNLHIICQSKLSLTDALAQLKSEYGCQRITIQSGGTLNGLFLREKLFDYIDIVIAPILVGGKDTSTLIDGRSLLSESELSQLGVLKLQECMVLENSYLRLRYQVIH